MSADSQTPPSSDDNGAAGAGANPFAAGLGLFQDWMKAAGSAMPNMGKAAGQDASPMGATLGGMGSLGAWTMPTLDPEELEKRITDLKTVQFWLEQNARMIAMTIQGLEVQRMTLSTLKGMNVSMDALRESLKARAAAKTTAAPEPGPEPPPAAQPEASAQADASQPAGGQGINPMQWWDTLTQQFTQLASQAAQASVDVGSAATNSMAQAAEAAAAGAAEVVKAAAQPVAKTSKKPSSKTAATKKAPAKKAATKTTRKSPGRGQAD